jgi:nicotinate-nucleotide adenylyltransferase
MKIGIFGGSFNPPHIGHLMACQYVLATQDIDRIWIAPAKTHPFHKKLLDFWCRYELCVKTFGNDCRFNIMNLEYVFTIDFIQNIINDNLYKHQSFSLIIGSDIIKEWTRWKDFKKIEELVSIIVVPRGETGHQALPNISSTEIRELLKNKQDVSKLITKDALEYIMLNKLEFERN